MKEKTHHYFINSKKAFEKISHAPSVSSSAFKELVSHYSMPTAGKKLSRLLKLTTLIAFIREVRIQGKAQIQSEQEQEISKNKN